MIITPEPINQRTKCLLNGIALLLKYKPELEVLADNDCDICVDLGSIELNTEDIKLLNSWHWLVQHFHSVPITLCVFPTLYVIDHSNIETD